MGSTRDSRNAHLVAQVEICPSLDFVISMSNKPSNRLAVSYKGEITLPFDPPTTGFSCIRISHTVPISWKMRENISPGIYV